jgi:hypothetical protein
MDKFDPKIHDGNPPMVATAVEHLRGSDPGWQTLINALLGELVADGRI